MNDGPTPVPDEEIIAAIKDGLRQLVLPCFPADASLDRTWDDVLAMNAADRLVYWFGDEFIAASAGDPAAVRRAIDGDLLQIDRMISAQLDAVLHHPVLQELEASWRGLRWLVDQVEEGPGDRVIVRALNISWHEIERDMQRASDFDQSQLFRKIYEFEFGVAGGEPFGLLLVDHAVRLRRERYDGTDDIAVLEHLAMVAAAAWAPTVVGAAPGLLGVETFAELGAVSDPAGAFRAPEYENWRRLRGRLDARFLAVAVPRVLARPLWADDGSRGDGFRYRERAATVAERLWMNAGFAFAAVAARAAARFGWPADVRGADPDRVGGGLVTTLPMDPHRLSQTLALPRLPVEVVFTDHQERALIESGLMPVGAPPHGEELLFGGVRSLHRPTLPAGPAGQAAFADSRIATQFNAILCASRFAHYLKMRGRQTIGRLRRPEEVELDLRTWLAGFVNKNPSSTAATRASHPLFDASVRVSERPDKPGVFHCSIELQPYFQLDNVTANFNFETEITPPRT